MTGPSLPMASVGVPVFNSERFLEKTLQSLLTQTFTDFELIISDNASTDGTAGLCRDLARADSRIRYVRQPENIGVPRNYNAVLALARGKYFKWSSSNDICQPQLLERCIAVLEARPDAVLAYAKTRLFDEDSGILRDHDDNMDLQDDDPVRRYAQCGERLFMNNLVNAVVRAQALKGTTLNWDYASSDMALTQELTLYGKFVEVPEYLFYRRVQSGARYGEGTKETFHEYYPDEEFGSTLRPRLQFAQRFRGVTHAPVALRQKLRLYGWLARRAWWARQELLGRRPASAKLNATATSGPVRRTR